tara:strand:- start:2404 stop:2724 length:321 start_codon:yes stop_codon:yes gene_type:complete
MATTHHNISGGLTQELLAAGDGVNVTSISLANVSASIACKVDIYIEKKLTGKFYIIKNIEIPINTTLVLGGGEVKFSNKINQFGLFIKLTKLGSGSGEPAVDVIIT